MIAAAVAALALGAADPCAPVEPVGPDPAAASAYRSVAEAESVRGSRSTAILAWRSAAALDPDDRASRDALARACGAGAQPDPLRDGMARMDAGDLRGAVADFAAARARRDDPAIALLQGICLYELGEDSGAEPVLRVAQRSPEDADLASLYLGLVAFRAGSAGEAAAFFDAASASAELAPVASSLARLARADGRWTLTVFATSGFDSNVNLAPAAGLPAREADGQYAVGASGALHPWGADGPYLRGQGILNRQLRLGAYDVSGGDLAAGWQLRRGGSWGLAEYDLQYRTLGGSPFLTAHRLLASAGTFWGGVGLGATWFARLESYADGYSPFSGTVQGGEVRASAGLGSRAKLALAYGAGRDAARLEILTWLEHGPRAELRVDVARGVRVGLDVAATFRTYAAFDPALGVRRADTYLDGGALVEWDLSQGLTALIAVHGRRALSNAPGLDYAKIVPTVGLSRTFSP